MIEKLTRMYFYFLFVAMFCLKYTIYVQYANVLYVFICTCRFDPLRFGSDADNLFQLREAEIKHSRSLTQFFPHI